MVTIRYTAWDGTQQVRLSADRAFETLAEYLTYTDDVQQAFEWLVRRGLDIEGVHVGGLDDLLRAVREEMRALQERYNLAHALDEPRRRLEELLARERAALAERGEPDARAGDEGLDRLPSRLGERIEQLLGRAFADPQAGYGFARLREELENIHALEEFERRYGALFRGPEALDYEQALALIRRMQRLKQMEAALVGGDLNVVGVEELDALLGAEWGRRFEQLRELVMLLHQSGYLGVGHDRLRLSPRGIRRIGELALRDIYRTLLRERSGTHAVDYRGRQEMRPEATKSYAFGDEFNLNLTGTLKNALARECRAPIKLHPRDFEVHETRHTASTSTVLLLDMSWSMSWEGRFAAAKKVALAMENLIRTRYPHDYFGIVGFYTRATELKAHELPEVSWNMGDPFTNLQEGLRLAGELLRRHPSKNQYMIVVTDGQPTAYRLRGRLYCEWPLSFGGIGARAARETLREVERVTRRGVVINTFMLDDSPGLRAFVEQMTRINKGRAFFTRPERLGEYLLVDYIARKRKRI